MCFLLNHKWWPWKWSFTVSSQCSLPQFKTQVLVWKIRLPGYLYLSCGSLLNLFIYLALPTQTFYDTPLGVWLIAFLDCENILWCSVSVAPGLGILGTHKFKNNLETHKGCLLLISSSKDKPQNVIHSSPPQEKINSKYFTLTIIKPKL